MLLILLSVSLFHRSRLLLGGFQGGSVIKNLPASAGDTGDASLISGLGRFPNLGNGNALQYFCLENPMDRAACQAAVHPVTKS